MNCMCGSKVGQPFLRIGEGERGGPADYVETYYCSWPCLAAAADAEVWGINSVEQFDRD